jgi:hypothetical protein
MTPRCNDAIDTLFEGLDGASEHACWLEAVEPSVELPAPGAPQPQPTGPSAVAWGEETGPAPESDPCVPCVGRIVDQGSSADLVIDLSQSRALPQAVRLDSVFLRIGTSFYQLPLDEEALALMAAGELAEIVLDGWGPLVQPSLGQPSLMHQLKTDPDADCSEAGECFWTSSPVLIRR